jgi:hypothetical protein
MRDAGQTTGFASLRAHPLLVIDEETRYKKWQTLCQLLVIK